MWTEQCVYICGLKFVWCAVWAMCGVCLWLVRAEQCVD